MSSTSSPPPSGASPSLDLAWARDELASIARKLYRVEEWFTHTVQAIEEESQTLRSELSELRAQKSSNSAVIDTLRRENEALKRNGDPVASTQMQKERDTALRKLRHARKKMRDLLEETKTEEDCDGTHIPLDLSDDLHVRDTSISGSSHTTTGESPDTGRPAAAASAKFFESEQKLDILPPESPLGHAEIRMGKKKASPVEKLPAEPEPSFTNVNSPKSEGSGGLDRSGTNTKTRSFANTKTPEVNSPRDIGERTERASSRHVTPKPSEIGRGATSTDSKGKGGAFAATSAGEPSTSCTSSKSGTVYEPEASKSASSVAASAVDPSVGFDGASSGRKTHLQHKKAPRAAVTNLGPLSEDDLQRYVELSFEDLEHLRRLPLLKGHGLRLFIKAKMAFLYDPMVRESPRSSHIVDWGSHETNLEVERRVTADKASPVFHTFIFPLEKEAWYYVGALRWTPMPLKDIWESLLPKAKHQLALVLRERWKDGPGVADISEMLTDKRLKQLCFELDGDQYTESTEAFQEEITDRMRAGRL